MSLGSTVSASCTSTSGAITVTRRPQPRGGLISLRSVSSGTMSAVTRRASSSRPLSPTSCHGSTPGVDADHREDVAGAEPVERELQREDLAHAAVDVVLVAELVGGNTSGIDADASTASVQPDLGAAERVAVARRRARRAR